jgi:uncharacterized protein (DUF1800 family)
MESESQERPPAPSRNVTRRAVIGGAAGAAALAALYAIGGRGLLSGGGDGDEAASGTGAAASDEARALAREEVRISHLLRRAGFGVTRQEYDRYQSMGLDATIDELVNWSQVDDSEAEALAGRIDITAGNIGAPVGWWLTRMANTKRPLQEKMTLFWHGHLTSQISVVKDPVAMVAQNEFFRANAFANFDEILKGVTRDPAMMVYLDIAGSVRTAPNENYARELMELFSLGVGNYSEQDVREGARAFTGWRIPRQRGDNNRPVLGEPVFAPRQYDNGVKTFLGEKGAFGPDEIVDIIVKQPASAEFITRKLFGYFVYPDPAAEDLGPFVKVYNDSGRNVGAVVEAMLRSDVFYSPRAYRAVVKSPVEYAIGAVKALGLQASVGQTLSALGGKRDGGGVLATMGQVPLEPPNVAGWPGGASWLNSSTLFSRLNFLNTITAGQGAVQKPRGGQAQPVLEAGTTAQALANYLPPVLDDNIPDEARQVLTDYAGGADATLTAERLRHLVYLVLGSPQFHLA